MRILAKNPKKDDEWRKAFAWLPVRLTEEPMIVWLETYEYNKVNWTDLTRDFGPYTGNGQKRLPGGAS